MIEANEATTETQPVNPEEDELPEGTFDGAQSHLNGLYASANDSLNRLASSPMAFGVFDANICKHLDALEALSEQEIAAYRESVEAGFNLWKQRADAAMDILLDKFKELSDPTTVVQIPPHEDKSQPDPVKKRSHLEQMKSEGRLETERRHVAGKFDELCVFGRDIEDEAARHAFMLAVGDAYPGMQMFTPHEAGLLADFQNGKFSTTFGQRLHLETSRLGALLEANGIEQPNHTSRQRRQKEKEKNSPISCGQSGSFESDDVDVVPGDEEGRVNGHKTKGDTQRAKLCDMPPMLHNVEPEKSNVLAYIRKAFDCDLNEAHGIFHSCRKKERHILLYDHVSKTWCGEQHTDVIGEIRKLQKRWKEQDQEIKNIRGDLKKIIDWINKR